MATSQTDHSYEYYINLFVTQRDFKRLPKGFSIALNAAQCAEEASSEKLFLDHGGLSTWVAHYLTRRDAESNAHFAGQAELARSLRTFEEQPVEFRISVAKGVKNALPSDVHNKFQTFSPNPRKRQRLVDTTASADLGEENDHQQRTSVHTSIGTTDDVNVSTDTFQNNPFFNLERLPALRLANLFPPLLADAISRQPPTGNSSTWAAAITMSFPLDKHSGNKLDSKLSLKIMHHRVGYFAMRLFGVHAESRNEEQYLVLPPTGLQIVPRPEVILRGCKREVILELFGEIVATAVNASLAYMEEEARGRALTQCVTMAVSSKASDEAVITLSLAEKECVRVKQALW